MVAYVLIWRHFHHTIDYLSFDGTVSGALTMIKYYRIIFRINKLVDTGRLEEADKMDDEWGDKLDELETTKTRFKQIVADLKARGISGKQVVMH